MKNTLYFVIRGTDSYFQVLSDVRMVLTRSIASKSFYKTIQARFLQVINSVPAKQILIAGNSLGGTTGNQLEVDYHTSNAVDPNQRIGMVISIQ